MPRNFKSTAVLQKPDPKFGSMLATKIINKLMQGGKKTTAQKIFYSALELAESKVEDLEGETQLERQEALFTQAIDNIRPSVEVRSKRVGGANYQVPREVKRTRQQALAIRWFVGMLERRTFHRFTYYCWAVGLLYLLAAWIEPGLR